MRQTIFLLSYAFVFLVSPLSAQEFITPESSRQMALENNKQMVIAAENSEIAGYNVKAYKVNYLPKISASGNYLLTTAEFDKTIPPFHMPTYIPNETGQLVPNILTTIDGIPLFKEYAYFPGMDLNLKPNGTYIAGVRLEQPIFTGGKITSAYKMSRIGEEMAHLNEVKTRAEVIMQADEAFWTYVETLELEKTARAYKDLVEQLQNDVENSYEAGMIPRNDLLKVQVKLNEVELQLMRAENGVRLAGMNLCHVIGLPLNSEIKIYYEFDSNNELHIPLHDISSRPDYALLSKQIELKEQQVKLVKSDFLPTVGIAGNMGYANGLKLNNNKLLDNTAFSAVVSVSIPVFHWGEGLNKVKRAMAEKRVATLQKNELAEKMELEVQQAMQAYNESKARVMHTKRSLIQAEENLRESSDRYESGLETLSDLIEAQTMWQQANYELIRANSTSQISETRYLKVAGIL